MYVSSHAISGLIEHDRTCIWEAVPSRNASIGLSLLRSGVLRDLALALRRVFFFLFLEHHGEGVGIGKILASYESDDVA
jgi:hypothetical protein